MPYKDPEKARESARLAQRRHYNKNKENILAKAKLARKEHPERFRETKRKHREKHPDFWRKIGLRRFGWTLEMYDLAFVEQKGLCAICGKPGKDGKLHSDHDHNTDTPRGLLCINCNTSLGGFKDNPDNLKKPWNILKNTRLRRLQNVQHFTRRRPRRETL